MENGLQEKSNRRFLRPLMLSRKHVTYAGAILATGVLAGAFAILFRGALHLVFARIFGEPDVLRAFTALPSSLRLLLPVAGGALAAGLGVIAARRSGGHGVAEVLEAVVLGRGRISVRTAAWKAVGSFVAMVTGGSVGREGPMLQFGAAAGSWVTERLGIDAKQGRALVAAGTAAGFAAAYNTPIAAVLFVLEVVTGLITPEVVLPVVVATTISTALTRFVVGVGPLYGLRSFSLAAPPELGAYAILGVLTGVVGVAFMTLLASGEKLAKGLRVPAVVRGAFGGIVVGVCLLRVPEVAGNGYEAIQRMLDARYDAVLLALLLVAKAVATTASVSTGSPGGVFTPSLFLGGAMGGLVGALVHAVAPAHGFLGGYVLVGMAGAIAATTHAPVMATVLCFELSGDYGVVLPLLIATVLATAVSKRLRADSIYTEELRRRGIPWQGTLAQRLARAVRAIDIMEKDPFCVDRAAPIREALDVLGRTRARVVFVTGGPEIQAIDLHLAAELWSGAGDHRGDLTCGDIAARVPSAYPNDSLLVLSEKLFDVDWGELPVAGPATTQVLGVVTRRALLAAFDRELLERDLLYTRVVWFEGQNESADYLELPRGHRVEIVAPPASAVGRPVDLAGVRADQRVTILGVRRSIRTGGSAEWVEPETVPSTSIADRWLVVGTTAAIDQLRNPSR